MVDLNSTIFVQMIGFLILLFTLNIILYKPILKVLRERKQVIDNLAEKANQLKKESEEKESRYNMQLSNTEENAKIDYNKKVQEASKQKEEMIAQETAKAREQIEQQKKEVFKSLDQEINTTREHSIELSDKIYQQLVA